MSRPSAPKTRPKQPPCVGCGGPKPAKEGMAHVCDRDPRLLCHDASRYPPRERCGQQVHPQAGGSEERVKW